MRIGLPFGKDKHKKIKLGLSMFIDDKGGITSIAFASALLVCLALVFALVSVAWVSSRAYKTQSIADAASMAGENVVAKYTTIAQVIDASILSLGLSGLLCVGAGLVASCVPGLASAGSKLCDAGFKTLEARKKFATSACEGLEEIEKCFQFLQQWRRALVYKRTLLMRVTSWDQLFYFPLSHNLILDI